MILPPPSREYNRDNETQTRVLLAREMEQLAANQPVRCLEASATWNPASIPDGSVETTAVSCPGAAVGDPVAVGFGANTAGVKLLWSAHVESADTVRVVVLNKNGAAVDLNSGTLTVLVWKRR